MSLQRELSSLIEIAQVTSIRLPALKEALAISGVRMSLVGEEESKMSRTVMMKVVKRKMTRMAERKMWARWLG